MCRTLFQLTQQWSAFPNIVIIGNLINWKWLMVIGDNWSCNVLYVHIIYKYQGPNAQCFLPTGVGKGNRKTSMAIVTNTIAMDFCGAGALRPTLIFQFIGIYVSFLHMAYLTILRNPLNPILNGIINQAKLSGKPIYRIQTWIKNLRTWNPCIDSTYYYKFLP